MVMHAKTYLTASSVMGAMLLCIVAILAGTGHVNTLWLTIVALIVALEKHVLLCWGWWTGRFWVITKDNKHVV